MFIIENKFAFIPEGANATKALRCIGQCESLDARPHNGSTFAFRDSGWWLVASVAELHSRAIHHLETPTR